MEEKLPRVAPGAAPGDNHPIQRTKFRPLLSTETAEWDTEEGGRELRFAVFLGLTLLAFILACAAYGIWTAFQ
jgi:hypothetical protein